MVSAENSFDSIRDRSIDSPKLPVVIMAGGLGKRAQGIDPTIPKPLIPIDGKPILSWEIDCLVRQGYTDIILTVSHMGEKIIDYFGDGSQYGCHITYFNETTPLGNAGALFKLWKSGAFDLPGDGENDDGRGSDYLLLNADSMFDVDFDRFVAFHKGHDALATLFVHPNSHPYDSGLIVTDNDGVVTNWLTKEDERPLFYGNCVNAGLHVLNTRVLDEIDIDPVTVGEEVDGKVVKVDLDRQILKPLCMDGGRVFAYKSPEYVKDMGTPERFEEVRADLESGLVSARNLSKPQKAVFLDRDGTINKYVGFLRNIDDFELLPGVAEAIRIINDSGYLAIVVTNQPVIARGEFTWDELDLIHAKMETLLGEKGAYLDGIYVCPHHPDKGFEGEIPELKFDCDCRKPKPGMLLQAAKEYNIDLSQSWMIGDSWRDVAVGEAAGVKTVLLDGDDIENVVSNINIQEIKYIPTMKAMNLIEAVEMVLFR